MTVPLNKVDQCDRPVWAGTRDGCLVARLYRGTALPDACQSRTAIAWRV